MPNDMVIPFGWSAKIECTAIDFGDETDAWRVQWAAEFESEPESSNILYYSPTNTNNSK